MRNSFTGKRALHIGTAIIWAAVMVGTSLFTEAENNRNLDWELMWIIAGGYLLQSALIGFYTRQNEANWKN